MSFSEYRNYSLAELKSIFKVKIQKNENLFSTFKPSDKQYSTLQTAVKKMTSRLNLSKSDNFATKREPFSFTYFVGSE